MKLEADALNHLKVKDLQRELKKRGLDTGGLKAALHQRLKEHLQEEEEAPFEETEDKSKEEGDNGKEEEETEKEQAAESVTEKSANANGEDEHQDETVAVTEKGANANGEDEDKEETVVGRKRGADAMEEESGSDAKKSKLDEEVETSPQPEDEDSGMPPSADAESREKATDEGTATTEEERKTLRIDNFIRPFTLNAVKALVQERGDFVEDGFWMDAIKTHCFVTYSTSEIAEKTHAALNGKMWPPENGRSLKVAFADHTAKEVSQHGEANLPTRPKSNGSSKTQATQRQKVTIDEFFQKTETKPVLYYLSLTDEQIKEKKQRQNQQQQEDQPRKRRHRGGRKRNRRARFRR